MSQAGDSLPLCVDCDGTLIHTDLLFESFLLLVKRNLWAALCVPFWFLSVGKAATKLRIAALVDIDASTLPYCEPVLDYIRSARQRGRQVVLATASARKYADAIAAHLGLFDRVLATDSEGVNLSKGNKGRRLSEEFGSKGFEYIGNSVDDVPVWREAGVVSIANASSRVRTQAVREGALGFESSSPWSPIKSALKAMRLHQWLKNTLILVPLLTAHQITDPPLLQYAVLAFLSFGLCASSVYILNDMLDIEADRRHSRKRLRPFACGSLSIPAGVALKLVLVITAFALASRLPQAFLWVLMIYYAVTLSYSLRLKAQVMVDVMLLSGLYTIRVIAGSAATGITPSFWLLSFSLFIFLSLALVKRYAEMRKLILEDRTRAEGRGYSTEDSIVLLALGAASGYSAVLVLALYLNSPDIKRLYAQPALLWFIIPMMAYWISRIWLKTHRGEMHDDPVVFAAKDWQSLAIGACIALVGVAASVV